VKEANYFLLTDEFTFFLDNLSARFPARATQTKGSPMSDHTPEYLSQIQPVPQQAGKEDKLAMLQGHAISARNMEQEIIDMEAQLKETKALLNSYYQNTMPALMQELGLDTIGIEKSGNKPGMDFKLKNFFAANIAASWPEEKRQAAFDLVTQLNAGDLIKTEVSAMFPKGGLKQAQKLLAQIKKIKIKTQVGKKIVSSTIKAELTKTIPHGSLSAWLRELVERHGKMLSQQELEKIGGSIGRVVKPEVRKE
jgi:hypothetical protein